MKYRSRAPPGAFVDSIANKSGASFVAQRSIACSQSLLSKDFVQEFSMDDSRSVPSKSVVRLVLPWQKQLSSVAHVLRADFKRIFSELPLSLRLGWSILENQFQKTYRFNYLPLHNAASIQH